MIKKISAPAILLSLASLFSSAAQGETVSELSPPLGPYGMVDIPSCTDNRGQRVVYVGVPTAELRKRSAGLAVAFRQNGHPVVKYDIERLPTTPPEFQNHVLAHECAHHKLGHFDRRYSPKHEEQQADCYALRVNNYGRKEAELIADTLDALYPFDPEAMINVTTEGNRDSLYRCVLKHQ